MCDAKVGRIPWRFCFFKKRLAVILLLTFIHSIRHLSFLHHSSRARLLIYLLLIRSTRWRMLNLDSNSGLPYYSKSTHYLLNYAAPYTYVSSQHVHRPPDRKHICSTWNERIFIQTNCTRALGMVSMISQPPAATHAGGMTPLLAPRCIST